MLTKSQGCIMLRHAHNFQGPLKIIILKLSVTVFEWHAPFPLDSEARGGSVGLIMCLPEVASTWPRERVPLLLACFHLGL